MGLENIDVRGMLDTLSPLIARAWGGSYIEEFRKQKNPKPDPNWLLNMCLRGNRPELARQLLDAGVDPLKVDPYETYAWQQAHEPEVALLLLEHGVTPNGAGEEGQADWLQVAAFYRKPKTIRLLLERGADPEARNKHNETALMIAARYGDVDCARALLDAGADPNAAMHYNWCDQTALTIAAGEGQDRVAQLLLARGTDLANSGRYALYSAAGQRGKGALRIVQQLLNAGVLAQDPTFFPLARAAASGTPDTVRALVAAGADPNEDSPWGPPLHAAIEKNRADTAAALLAAGADPHLQPAPKKDQPDSGKSPLELARARRKKKLVELLEVGPVLEPAATPTASVPETWKRIEKWLKKNAPKVHRSLGKPVEPEALARAEGVLGAQLPEDLKASLLIHDGQAKDLTLIPAPDPNDAGYSLLDLEGVVREWKTWKELLDGGDFAGQTSGPDAGVRDDWWNPAWIPFTTNGGGDHHCVDLAPAESGAPGQIITMYHAEEKRERVAGSFREWLANLAEELENGAWTVDDEGGIAPE